MLIISIETQFTAHSFPDSGIIAFLKLKDVMEYYIGTVVSWRYMYIYLLSDV